MSYIKVFDHKSREYELLEKLAMILTCKSPRKYRYLVGQTYFDYGQGWMWTTVLCDTGSAGITGRYQALNPREQEEILQSDGSFEAVAAIADEVLADKFCPDKEVAC